MGRPVSPIHLQSPDHPGREEGDFALKPWIAVIAGLIVLLGTCAAGVDTPGRQSVISNQPIDNPLALLLNSPAFKMAAGKRANSLPDRPVIRVNDLPVWDTDYALFVLAGQTVRLTAEVPQGFAQHWEGDGQFLAEEPPPAAASVSAKPAPPKTGPYRRSGRPVIWVAPTKAGPATLVLKMAEPGRGWVERARINILVMVPAEKMVAGCLLGYAIGRYPTPQPESPVAYMPPPGFLKLSPSSSGTRVSPHFCLEDFACKQLCSGDRYLYLEPRLLPFLEAVTARVEMEGFAVRTPGVEPPGGHLAPTTGTEPMSPTVTRGPITIMSGYRTPVYNRRLHTALRSRHQYGDAADIFVDSDGDGTMDDLNRDHVIDVNDALTLARWIEETWALPAFADRPGGLGVYRSSRTHGPFVHVDLRGQKARWGANGLDWDDLEGSARGE